MAEHVTVDLAANRIEQAAEKRGLDAARALLSRTLAARRPMNLWRI